jgi:hypothetical protein
MPQQLLLPLRHPALLIHCRGALLLQRLQPPLLLLPLPQRRMLLLPRNCRLAALC